jgi:hypothetical protein
MLVNVIQRWLHFFGSAPAGDREVKAILRQAQRDAEANAACAARHQRNFVPHLRPL